MCMKRSAPPLPPQFRRQLSALGLRLRLARERRDIATEVFAQRLGVSRETLRRLEKGDDSVSMGSFLRALRVLGLDKDIDKLAADDVLGRKLQDIQLLGNRHRAQSSQTDGEL
jgi:transcriptional regulator with XRE-family HTH domain